VSIALKGQ